MSQLVDRIRREEELKNPTPPSDIPPTPGIEDLIAAEIDAWLIQKGDKPFEFTPALSDAPQPPDRSGSTTSTR